MKKIIGTISLIGLLGAALFSFNYLTVGKPLSDILDSESRNSGISISAHYKGYIQPSILAVDIKMVSRDKSAADVFRVLLQYASKLKETRFDTILLKSNGKTKFVLEGDYFQELGMEYGHQNPIYTMRTFSENLYTPDGNKAFRKWTGGLLGVLRRQMEDFGEFHKKWYVEDMNKA